MDLEIYILFGLLLLSGFFSSAEIAFFSIPQASIRLLIEQKTTRAQRVESLKKKSESLLLTIVIANILTNIAAVSLATIFAMDHFGTKGAFIAVCVMTVLILFFGEIIPKAITEKRALQTALAYAPLIQIIVIILYPIVFLLHSVSRMTQNLFRGDDNNAHNSISEEELKAMVAAGHEEGSVETDEKEMIEKVFQLNDITAGDIMTPEEYMVSFQKNMLVADTLHIIQETGHSRFPVLSDTGEVEGVLYIKDVFSHLVLTHSTDQETTDAQKKLETPVQALMQPPIFIPENTQADELLKEFQKKRKHIGIVVDEHGNVQGLVTLEDLLEEIVGEIIDESDYDDNMIEKIDANTLSIDPRISIGKINTEFRAHLKGSKHKTIGWLALKHFGRIPEKGDQVIIDDHKFIVEEADDRRIKRLTIIKTAKAKMRS